ncbi:hypothetical protein BDZ97DRAFT_1927595 [Flammula alnicola]|nr:hypothetical protein BDZ97DRAFT_1927595 [Flammula alnicola]
MTTSSTNHEAASSNTSHDMMKHSSRALKRQAPQSTGRGGMAQAARQRGWPQSSADGRNRQREAWEKGTHDWTVRRSGRNMFSRSRRGGFLYVSLFLPLLTRHTVFALPFSPVQLSPPPTLTMPSQAGPLLVASLRFFDILGCIWTGLGLGLCPWGPKDRTGPDFKTLPPTPPELPAPYLSSSSCHPAATAPNLPSSVLSQKHLGVVVTISWQQQRFCCCHCTHFVILAHMSGDGGRAAAAAVTSASLSYYLSSSTRCAAATSP